MALLFDDEKEDRRWGASGQSTTNYERCYTKHPPLVIGETGLKIWGGSCYSPIIDDADVYIGFDSGMNPTRRSWPWSGQVEFLFKISDMAAPSSATDFTKLVEWTAAALKDGKKVHCGCIGGHGRTGTFLAALVCVMTGEKDAIAYVRKHYCVKAVESEQQVKFLHDVFGITKTHGHKDGAWKDTGKSAPKAKSGGKKPSKEERVAGVSQHDRWRANCIPSPMSIWG